LRQELRLADSFRLSPIRALGFAETRLVASLGFLPRITYDEPGPCVDEFLRMDKLLQLLYPASVKFKCPRCNSEIPYFDVKIGFGERWVREQFPCPSCKCSLCVSGTYAWLVFLGCFVLAVSISVGIGVHPWLLLLLSTFCIWFLLGMLAGAYVKVLFPPKITQFYPNDLSLNLGKKE
jgi:hypothetical protein